jgi:hypothetical protein
MLLFLGYDNCILYYVLFNNADTTSDYMVLLNGRMI